MGRQGMRNQLRRRTLEGLLQQIRHQVPLGLFPGKAGVIDLGSLALIPSDQTLFGHDLKKLQRRGVTGRSPLAELILHLTDRARPPLPKHPEHFELSGRRSWNPKLGRSSYIHETNLNGDLRGLYFSVSGRC